jgi:hypothetical protein
LRAPHTKPSLTAMRPLAAAALAGLLASPALAAPAPPATPALPPKTVAGVTVMPRTDPPKIVSSFPAPGEVIAPGALVLHITFDQKMDEEGFAFAAGPGGRMPDCLKTPRLLNDEKTFVLLCTTVAESAYSLAFNANPQGGPQGGFANIGGTHAAPAQLAFSTDNKDGPRDLDEALKIAKLTRLDVPIATQP